MSPVIITVMLPCGVCATSVSFMAFPSTVPVTGTSPIWLPKVPLILPASSVSVALAGRSPPGVLTTTSHLPAATTAPDEAVDGVDSVVVGAAGVVGVDSAVSRLPFQSPSANPPKSAFPLSVSPSSLPVSVMSSGMPWT